jgi:tetratricopeptide (TPR) repeat protein
VTDFRIFLLTGQLRVEQHRGGKIEMVDLGRGKLPVAILVGLATEPNLRAPAAASLRSLCYEGIPPTNWKPSLEQAISRLRKKTGLPIAEGTYRLELDPDSVDILHFERLAKAAIDAASNDHQTSLRLSQEALRLWLQDPSSSFADHPLLESVFDRFTKLRRRLMHARVRVFVKANEIAAAEELLEDAMHHYPNDAGLRSLREELDNREEPVVSSSRPRRRVPQHNLPPPDEGHFIGRDAVLSQIRQILLPYPRSQYPVLTIDGVGGVGKSALVKRAAYSYVEGTVLADDDPGFAAIVWTSAKRTILGDKIHEITPTLRNLEDVYSAIAVTLGRGDVLTAPSEDHPRLVRQLLADNNSRVLLIVDNLETVDDERIASFLRDLPAPTKAIVTTRHRLDGALPLRLEGLNPPDAEHLGRLTAASRQIELGEPVVTELASASAGIPLAIIWTVSQVAKTDDAQNALRRLRSASGDYARFCFHQSVEMLRRDGHSSALDLLYAAALFADDASREAIGAVGGLNDRRVERDSMLATLTDLSLINFRDARFYLLPLTKEFVVGEIGRDLTIREPSVDRWLDWHRRLTAGAAAGGADLDAKILSTIRREHTNILWAIDFSMRNDRPDYFVALVRCMEFFWLGEGLWNEFEHYLDRGRILAPTPEDKIHFAGRLMWLEVLRDQLERAAEMRAAAELLLRRFDVPYERMRLEDFTGQMYLQDGQFDRAEEHLRESLRLAADLEDRRGQFATLKYLGELYCERWNADEARKHLDQAEKFVGDPGDVQWLRGLAHTAQLQGRIAEVTADWRSAETAYRECLRLLRFHPDARLQTRAQEGLARALWQEGEHFSALDELHDASHTFERLGMWAQAERVAELSRTWRAEKGLID